MTKIGPKEAALKSKRAEIMDRIPDFLRADKRAAKRKPKAKPDNDPVTLAPPLAVQKAIEKDLSESDPVIEAKAELAQTLSDIASPPPPTDAAVESRYVSPDSNRLKTGGYQPRPGTSKPKPPTTGSGVDAIPIADLHKHPAATSNRESWDKIPAVKKASEKKLPRVLQKALAEKERLNQPTHSAKANPMETTVKKSAKKTTAKKTVTKKAKVARKSNGSYDWPAAEAMAKAGKLPPLPSFRSYAPHIKDLYELAKKKDVAGIKVWAAEFKNEKGARANMFRFRDLCVTALKK